MTTRNVAAAVAAIERRDPALGDWAQVAADGLTAGEGEETLCQAFVQDFLWYRLPTKYPERAWGPIARASESLLRELRLERYASIAGSDMTASILEAWREDDARGFARYQAAAEASGVKPPMRIGARPSGSAPRRPAIARMCASSRRSRMLSANTIRAAPRTSP